MLSLPLVRTRLVCLGAVCLRVVRVHEVRVLGELVHVVGVREVRVRVRVGNPRDRGPCCSNQGGRGLVTLDPAAL